MVAAVPSVPLVIAGSTAEGRPYKPPKALDARPELGAVADPRIMAMMDEVRRVRFGQAEALAFFEIERTITGGEHGA